MFPKKILAGLTVELSKIQISGGARVCHEQEAKLLHSKNNSFGSNLNCWLALLEKELVKKFYENYLFSFFLKCYDDVKR